MNKDWSERLAYILLLLFSVILLISGIANLCRITCGQSKKYDYAATGSVVSVDGDDAVYETADGNLWRASAEGFSAGDDVVLLFDDKGTPSIYDDEILRVIPLK